MASNHTFGVVQSANDEGLLARSVCVFGRIFDVVGAGGAGGAEQSVWESVGVGEIFGGAIGVQGY